MKFKIRFADQLVGIFIVLSLASLVAVVVLLGKSQRWFSKDYSFHTLLPSATGLSQNMPVQYKGFTIGSVKKFYLADSDDVEVIFIIHEEYHDRIKKGSMVEVMISPIGLGNQFLLHPGRGDQLEEGAFVPVAGSAEARELIRLGLAPEPRHDDSITLLLNRVSSILAQVDEALGPGSNTTEIGKIVGSLKDTLAGVESIPKTVEEILGELEPVLASINTVLANVNTITAELADPENLLFTVLDTKKDVYVNLVSSLGSISSLLDNLDRTLGGQLPQVAGLIMELRTTVKNADDVLVSLTNNPLLKRGVPDRVEGQSGGTNPRDIRF